MESRLASGAMEQEELPVSRTAWAPTTQWTEGLTLSPRKVSFGEIDHSAETSWTFFAVKFEIPDVFCLLFGFILIIKRVYTDMGKRIKIMV